MSKLVPAHFPVVVEQLAERWFPTPDEKRRFRDLARLAGDLEHHFAAARLDVLRDLYSPFDPDEDTPSSALEPGETAERVARIFDRTADAFEHANFEVVARERFLSAPSSGSVAGIKVELGVDRIERFAAWCRGEGHKATTIRFARKLFRLTTVEVPTFTRAAIVYRAKDEPRVHMRVYKDVAQSDLHLLFPSVRLRMRLLDKFKLSSSGSAAIWSAVKLSLLSLGAVEAGTHPSIKVAVFLFVLVVCTIYVGKVLLDYTTIKASYATIVVEHLHTLGVASNGSVVAHLAGLVAEEEAKEVVVAYAILHAAGEAGRTAGALGDAARAWIREKHGRDVEFDVPDALAKLEERALVRKLETGLYIALPLDEAVSRLARTWDELRPVTEPAPETRHESI